MDDGVVVLCSNNPICGTAFPVSTICLSVILSFADLSIIYGVYDVFYGQGKEMRRLQ